MDVHVQEWAGTPAHCVCKLLKKLHCDCRMVAQPESHPRTAAPSANTMAAKRDAPEGAESERSASVKSTRISDENVEMFSPSGELAVLAATPGLTPAPSLAPTSPETSVVAAVKRSRAGARSVPPTLMSSEDSPTRPERRVLPIEGGTSPAFEARVIQAIEEINQRISQSQEQQNRDRQRITCIARDTAAAFNDFYSQGAWSEVRPSAESERKTATETDRDPF